MGRETVKILKKFQVIDWILNTASKTQSLVDISINIAQIDFHIDIRSLRPEQKWESTLLMCRWRKTFKYAIAKVFLLRNKQINVINSIATTMIWQKLGIFCPINISACIPVISVLNCDLLISLERQVSFDGCLYYALNLFASQNRP